MGLLGNVFGWQDNPAYQGLDANRNTIGGISSGLLGGMNPISYTGPTPPGGQLPNPLATALQGGMAGATQDQQLAQDKAAVNASVQALAQFPDLQQAVHSRALTPQQAYTEMFKRMDQKSQAPSNDIQNYEYGLSHPGFQAFQTQKGGAAETALQPTWGIDTDPKSPTYGKAVLGQLNKAGGFIKTQLPPGVQPLDPRDLAGGKASAVVDAKTAAGARAALPGAEQAYALTTKALDSLTGPAASPNLVSGENEQFGNVLGIPQQWTPATPGSAKADFRNIVDQLSGQAFLQIRQALKGAGQVTDFEGTKGELAISRMRAAAEKGSKADFDQALADYKSAIDNGMVLLRNQANGSYGAGMPDVNGNSGPPPDVGYTVISVQ